MATPKWPHDHSDKHRQAAIKGWRHRRLNTPAPKKGKREAEREVKRLKEAHFQATLAGITTGKWGKAKKAERDWRRLANTYRIKTPWG